MIGLSHKLFQNFIWPPTGWNVMPTFPLTSNPVLVGRIWKDWSKCGLVYRVEGPQKIKGQVFGATQWTISLHIGTGPSSSHLVRRLLRLEILLTHLISGLLFKKKYGIALTQSKVYEDEFTFLSQKVSNCVCEAWMAMITDWEKDHTKPNPYYTPLEGEQV